MKTLLKLTEAQRRKLVELAPDYGNLTREEFKEWIEQDRRRNRWSERAANLLLAADPISKFTSCMAAAKDIGISRNTLALWLRRFRESGVAGITTDAPRSGRPREIPAAKLEQIKSALRKNRRLKARRESIRAIAKRFEVWPMTVRRLNQGMDTKR